MTTTDNTTQAVLEKLLTDHIGRENSITQTQLAEALGVNPSTLRSELRRLREQRELPIGNLRDGYFVIGDREELQEFVGHINQEIESKRKTIEHTTEAFASFDATTVDIPTGTGDDAGTDADSDESTEPAEPAEPTYECDHCGGEMVASDRRYPDQQDEPVCRQCFGQWLMNGKSFDGIGGTV